MTEGLKFLQYFFNYRKITKIVIFVKIPQVRFIYNLVKIKKLNVFRKKY